MLLLSKAYIINLSFLSLVFNYFKCKCMLVYLQRELKQHEAGTEESNAAYVNKCLCTSIDKVSE
jgi:hypothetical protein